MIDQAFSPIARPEMNFPKNPQQMIFPLDRLAPTVI
jgi:hypothetical protein